VCFEDALITLYLLPAGSIGTHWRLSCWRLTMMDLCWVPVADRNFHFFLSSFFNMLHLSEISNGLVCVNKRVAPSHTDTLVCQEGQNHKFEKSYSLSHHVWEEKIGPRKKGGWRCLFFNPLIWTMVGGWKQEEKKT